MRGGSLQTWPPFCPRTSCLFFAFLSSVRCLPLSKMSLLLPSSADLDAAAAVERQIKASEMAIKSVKASLKRKREIADLQDRLHIEVLEASEISKTVTLKHAVLQEQAKTRIAYASFFL